MSATNTRMPAYGVQVQPEAAATKKHVHHTSHDTSTGQNEGSQVTRMQEDKSCAVVDFIISWATSPYQKSPHIRMVQYFNT
ncbi:hypothetical protein V492_01647 [Pseudogymnoascus sp. VKM F-4246]|nr:hypothetical protein V492_01647 [Pseudogymnoascus sp. VKM F-4246]